MDNSNNISSPVCCCSPSFLFNPKFYEWFVAFPLVTPRGELHYEHYSHFTPENLKNYIYTKVGFSIDNYTQFYYRVGGRRVPLLYLLPCGHCDICKENKANEYAFRASCETAIYPENPLFVTLTYNDKSLPREGLVVDHVQRFFKRLRARLKMLGLPSDFRYLCVGEYGTKYGRPHYHFMMWNYPYSSFKDFAEACRPINASWLTYVLVNGKRKYFHSKKTGRILPVMRSHGMIKILPVLQGCPRYIVKYFGKLEHNPLHYPGKPFLISSRGNGGIGSQFLRDHYKFVYNNRAVKDLKLSVLDPTNNTVATHSVSGYLKNYLFKPLSQLFAKKRQYLYIIKIKSYFHELIALSYKMYYEFKSKHMTDYAKFRFNVLKMPVLHPIIKNLRYFLKVFPRRYYEVNYSYLPDNRVVVHNMFHSLLKKIRTYYSWLDCDYIADCNQLAYERSQFYLARENFDYNTTYNIVARLQKCDYRYQQYLNKCTF